MVQTRDRRRIQIQNRSKAQVVGARYEKTPKETRKFEMPKETETVVQHNHWLGPGHETRRSDIRAHVRARTHHTSSSLLTPHPSSSPSPSGFLPFPFPFPVFLTRCFTLCSPSATFSAALALMASIVPMLTPSRTTEKASHGVTECGETVALGTYSRMMFSRKVGPLVLTSTTVVAP